MNLLVLIILSLLPGLITWWLGRNLIRDKDKPLSPERYAIYLQRVFIIFFLGVLMLSFSFTYYENTGTVPVKLKLLPLVLLMVLAILAGSFPSRRFLLKESWSFLQYLAFKFKFLLTFWSFTLLLIFTPYLIASSDQQFNYTISMLALLLYGRMFLTLEGVRKLLGAHHLTEPVLLARLQAITSRTQVELPVLMVLELGGGCMANAFALPALPKPGVIFTINLLAALEPDEIDAIYAHELAHLEDMDANFFKKKALLNISLITIALLIVPLLQQAFQLTLSPYHYLFFGVFLGYLQIKVFGHGRDDESHSDSRAIELCGNPDALKSGLEKLHDINHVPHRWSLETEKASSHPSLSNRKRSIAQSAETANINLEQPIAVPRSMTGNFVVFENKAIHWLEGVKDADCSNIEDLLKRASHKTSLAYTELQELFLKPTAKNQGLLIATDTKGRKYKASIPFEKIADVQAALHVADQHIVQHAPSKIKTPYSFYIYSLAIAGFAYLLESYFPLLTVGLLCLFRPSYLTLATLGALAVGESIRLLIMQSIGGMQIYYTAFCLVLGLFTLSYTVRTYLKEPTTLDKNFWLLLGLLGFPVAAAVLQFLFALPGLNYLRIHDTAVNSPVYAVALLGLAAAILFKLRMQKLWLSALFASLSLLTFFLQSSDFGTPDSPKIRLP